MITRRFNTVSDEGVTIKVVRAYTTVDGSSLAITWDNIAGKPATFPPSTHAHAWADITSGVPTTWAPSSHGDAAHSETYVKATGTPVNNQIGVWTAASTMEGVAALTWDGTNFNIAGIVKATYLYTNSDTGYFGKSGTWEGSADDHIAIGADGARAIKFYTNGSVTVKASITTGGNFEAIGEITAYA